MSRWSQLGMQLLLLAALYLLGVFVAVTGGVLVARFLARKDGEARIAAARQEALRRVADARCKVEEAEDAAHEAALARAQEEGRRIGEEAAAAARAVVQAAEPEIPRLVAEAIASIVGEGPC